MSIKVLTVEGIKALKRAKVGQQYEVSDQGYPGLHIRVGRLRKTFEIYYRLGGALHRKKIGCFPATSLAQAREAWRQTRANVDAGLEPISSPPRSAAPASRTPQQDPVPAALELHIHLLHFFAVGGAERSFIFRGALQSFLTVVQLMSQRGDVAQDGSQQRQHGVGLLGCKVFRFRLGTF